MKLFEIALYENKSHRLLQEGWQELTEAQQNYQLRFERELWPLLESYVKLYEATLTPQQIDAIFTSAEEKAIAGGNNKTTLGKVGSTVAGAAKLPVDIAKKVNAKIDELGRMAQQAGPIQNADAKFEKLKQDILANKPDSKIVQGIQKVSDWAKENPGKASLAVGVLTTIAAFIGGPAGGAAAGLVLRATKDLLQGEKLSTAVGKSIKTAALGALAGKAFEMVGDWLGGLRADVVMKDQFADVSWDATKTITAPGMEWTQSIKGVNIKVLPDDAETINGLMKVLGGSDPSQRIQAFDKLYGLAKEIRSPEYKQLLSNVGEMAKNNDSLFQWIQSAKTGLQSISQGAIAASDGKKQESMEERFQQYLSAQQLDEGPLDALKKGASAVGGALKKGAEKVANIGKNLGNKVTKDKLMKAWKAAGSPTEAGEVAKVLQQAGVSDDIIKTVGAEQKIELPLAAKAEPGAETTPSGQPKIEPTLDTPSAAPPTRTTPAAGQTSAQAGVPQATPTAGSAPKAGPNAKQLTPIVNMIKKANVVDAVKAMLQKEVGSTQSAAQPSAQNTTKPAAGNATQQPASAQKTAAKPAAVANKAAGDTFEKAKSDIRKVQSGTKPLPDKMSQGIQADLAKLAKGDKESGVFAAQKIMNFAKAGYDISKLQPAWIANAKQGERFLTQSVYYAITKMLREYNLGWADLGLRIRLVENTNDVVGINYI
jgi:hypothetical protein